MSEKLDRIPLDYGRVASTELLENLSGVAVNGDTMWIVSDEGRTIECLKAERRADLPCHFRQRPEPVSARG